MSEQIIGIMGAMPEEISGIIELLDNKKEQELGMRTYYTGTINGIKTVVVFSRWGKVAAAATITSLILEFNITELIFTGVAGAVSGELKIGDIVIAKRLIQHDMDARPLMQQFEIPLLGKTFFETPLQQLTISTEVLNELANENKLTGSISAEELIHFNIKNPTCHTGDIASGDHFFSSQVKKNELLSLLPSILCVEMEGAAVAQVCYEYDIPFTIIRTISDAADENSLHDFPRFIREIAGKYSTGIITALYKKIAVI